MKNSIKRAQSQARLSFAERENQRSLAGGKSNFRPKVRQLKKTLLTLVALLAVTTGAWAADVITVTWSSGDTYENNNSKDGVTLTGDNLRYRGGEWQLAYDEEKGTFTTELGNFTKIEITGGYIDGFSGEGWSSGRTWTGNAAAVPFEGYITDDSGDEPWTITFTIEPASAPSASSGPEVAWDKAKNSGSFTMPGGNVTLEPDYYPQAALTAAPTAINDVPATTDGAIVNAGTVANIGETETAQGTVMYYVSQTALDDAALLALAADQWTADVPTAQSLAQGQAYVYYYVRGNDSNNDDENFSDGDILAANALTVTIAAEPTYAVTFADGVNPEPPAEPEWTASPAAGVKKGQTVTVTYTGSKKVIGVKAEKKAKAPAADVTWDATNVTDIAVYGTSQYEKEGIKLSGNAEEVRVMWNNTGDPETDGIVFKTNESGGFTFTAPTGKAFTKIEMKLQGPVGWDLAYDDAKLGTGWAFDGNNDTVTWTGSAASTVDLLKDTDDFDGANVKSIAFYLSE